MNTETLFIEASQRKMRFESANGLLAVEDLWDLPLRSETRESLNSIASRIDDKISSVKKKKDFITKTKRKIDDALKIAMGIVEFIIDVKIELEEKAKRAAAVKEEKDELLELLHNRNMKDKRKLSKEELEDQIAKLS